MYKVLNFYSVLTKCGHVSKKYYIPIAFPVCALNKKQAASIARKIPRVKHDHKDAIIKVEKISYCKYLILQYSNNNDPYLKCKNKQDQALISDLNERLEVDRHYYDYMERKKKKKKNHEYQKLKEKCLIQSYKQEFCSLSIDFNSSLIL